MEFAGRHNLIEVARLLRVRLLRRAKEACRFHALIGTRTEVSMTKSPGHRHYPEYKVAKRYIDERMQVIVAGEIVADSCDVIKVEEEGARPRYYFPQEGVRAQCLDWSPTVTVCPFKGIAQYFNINASGRVLEDAAWSYANPYEEHAALKGRFAFYEEKAPEIDIRALS
jgi:uncharacterized protein (DUF427 family)